MPFWNHSGAVNLTIKDVPARLHRKLRARAEANNRSLNWEVISILQDALESSPVDVDALLDQVRQIRARISGPPLNDALLGRTRQDGRP
jgi:plasmid stability protein